MPGATDILNMSDDDFLKSVPPEVVASEQTPETKPVEETPAVTQQEKPVEETPQATVDKGTDTKTDPESKPVDDPSKKVDEPVGTVDSSAKDKDGATPDADSKKDGPPSSGTADKPLES